MAIDRTFPLDVENVGHFVFRKRRIPDQIKIEAAARRMLDGSIEDSDLYNICLAYQTLSLLVVKGPDGWDLDEMDPLNREDTDKLWAVWNALRAEEARFRQGA